jgi:hypothetical protein
MYEIRIEYANNSAWLVGNTDREDTVVYVLDALKQRGYDPQVYFNGGRGY